MDWFSVRVLSGKEKKIRDALLNEVGKNNGEYQIEEVLVPSENVVEMRSGKKVVRNKVFYPGYILVKMEINVESRHFIENTPGVISFVGPKGEPESLKQDEVSRILGEVETRDGVEVMVTKYKSTDKVRVIDGPFVDFIGDVQEVDNEKQKMKVLVSIFGRATPVELDFLQVEHVK
ncbi:MAG: transcription termination/antitermination protein NusG [Candidatus Marinimicrobia bacterium]|jgi:transcriptional antiterminator NusG|nr:transcription termination/antitermination factor NusG [Candidatus Neomarinimicrobiota bacterium]MDP6455837.1 transcription termination/antitermination protein NusG [Candidatus Neomarinimicrobiota bacterium]MDP6594094.1 transcription termination/antitermination protein NusG [Candidatus Neomarinimicrobiota bacterium]MDP6837047.1 transcription termination/antitermination protein NusG [Candidatus Neomarinimicrobiota bacterium]|tara:strand:- start:13171 stop:13698 length:528 start_codon:yes stop_codon:yes gene_type:complete